MAFVTLKERDVLRHINTDNITDIVNLGPKNDVLIHLINGRTLTFSYNDAKPLIDRIMNDPTLI